MYSVSADDMSMAKRAPLIILALTGRSDLLRSKFEECGAWYAGMTLRSPQPNLYFVLFYPHLADTTHLPATPGQDDSYKTSYRSD